MLLVRLHVYRFIKTLKPINYLKIVMLTSPGFSFKEAHLFCYFFVDLYTASRRARPQNLKNFNVTQLLIVWFSQSEIVLHSNAPKCRKIWRTTLRMFLRMVAKYGPWSSCAVRLTLSQTKSFRLFQTERVCRRQF